jgi:hypothetical protein
MSVGSVWFGSEGTRSYALICPALFLRPSIRRPQRVHLKRSRYFGFLALMLPTDR